MGYRASRARRRRLLALAACSIWLFGYEVGPNLHIGLHVHLAAHSHGHGDVGASHSQHTTPVDHGHGHHGHAEHGRSTHHHGDHAHAHGHDPRPEPTDAELSLAPTHPSTGVALVPFTPDPLDHGAHSLAHRAMTATTPPPALTHPLPVSLRPVPHDWVLAQAARSRRPLAPLARGPPASIS